MDKCENRRLEYLWGTFLRALRKKKSIFFENGRARSERSIGREDSARGIGAWFSREGLGKMPWHSSVCARMRYAKTIPRRRGIAFLYCADNQRFEWQGSPVLISCCSIMINRLLVYKL